MRRPFIHGAGSDAPRPKGLTLVPASLRKLDQFTTELVNGDDGGTWAPSKPIVVGAVVSDGGVGAEIDLTTAGSSLTGQIETVDGNGAQPLPLAGDQITGLVITTDAGAPTFETSRSRTIAVPFTEWTEGGDDEPNTHLWSNLPFYELDTSVMAPRSRMPPGQIAIHTGKFDAVGMVAIPQRAIPRGGRITSVEFRYAIGRRYLALPGRPPQFRVIRLTGFIPELLHSAAGAYASGWLPDSSAATPTAYWNRGSTRSITYIPNQNNAAIDPTNQHFVLQWMDDDVDIPDGAPGNIFLGAVVTIDSISQLRPE